MAKAIFYLKKETSHHRDSKKIFEHTLASFVLLALIGLGIALLTPYALNIQSAKANINGKLVDVRTPIAGNLILKNYESGQVVTANEELGTIHNPRVDTLLLKREELEGQLSKARKQLEGLKEKRANYQSLLAEINQYVDQQTGKIDQQQQLKDQRNEFEVGKLERQVNEAKLELEKKVKERKKAEKEAYRFGQLAKAGGISINDAEKFQLIAEQAQKEVSKATEQYQQKVLELQATKSGLSSDQLNYRETIGNTEERRQQLIMHKQQVLTARLNLEQESTGLQGQVEAIETELKQVKDQLQANGIASIKSPITGPIWSVIAQSNEYLGENNPILELVNCDQRWVEALFPETIADKLEPGRPVKVNLLGPNKRTLNGRIEASRAGIGRVSPGEDVIPYIGEKLPNRQVALRISVDWPKENNYQEYCYVGRGAEVNIPRFF